MLLETLDDLLLDQLRNLYSIETQVEVALPLLVADITSAPLREMLTQHFEETEGQIVRLQEIFGTLGVSARGPRCLGISALLQEAQDCMRRSARGGLLDTVVIGCMQRVKHYEMASYISTIAYARQLGQPRIAELLTASLSEESETDLQLGHIADTDVLEQGANAGVLAA